MKSNQLLIAFALISATSATASPTLSTYTYTVRVPASSTTCEGAANILATFFQAAAPKLKNIQGQCVTRTSFMEDGERFTVDQIKVTYESTSPIVFATAQIPNASDYTSTHGYQKYAECLNDLGAQSNLYAQATGLNPIAATCVPESSAYFGYTMKIDAIGTPARTLKLMYNLSHVRIDSNPSWKQKLVDFITQAGGMVAKVNSDTISYYGASSVAVGAKSWYHTDTLEQCQAQANEVSSILSKLGAKNLVTECHGDAASPAHASHYYLDTIFAGPIDAFYDTTYHENFYTYDECMAVRASVSPELSYALGSFCSASDFGDGRYSLISIVH